MQEYAQKPEQSSSENNSRSSGQPPISEILQAYKNGTLQRMSVDEEELLQAKTRDKSSERETLQLYTEYTHRDKSRYNSFIQGMFDTPQRKGIDDEEPLQGKFDSSSAASESTVQREVKPNNTGLPDNLKSGIENLSGYSMDDVKVHYNSDKPAQLSALAYAQGTDIHVAPGQERHLPHEAWHVVQQKQGRVQPTMQMQGVDVNDNEGLEREADVMGKQAAQRGSFHVSYHSTPKYPLIAQRQPNRNSGISYDLLGSKMSQIFKGRAGHDNTNSEQENSVQNSMAHLGWHSSIEFDTNGNSFNHFDSQYRDSKLGLVGNADQIVTRGVDSCTVIIVSRGDSHIMLHLDAADMTQGNIDKITRKIPVDDANHIPPTIFVSIQDDRGCPEPRGAMTRTGFTRKLICTYLGRDTNQLPIDGDLGMALTNGAEGDHKIRILNRNPSNPSERFVHPELGLYRDSQSRLRVFGSLASTYDSDRHGTLNDMINNNRIRDFDLPLDAPQSLYNDVSDIGQDINNAANDARITEAVQSNNLWGLFQPIAMAILYAKKHELPSLKAECRSLYNRLKSEQVNLLTPSQIKQIQGIMA